MVPMKHYVITKFWKSGRVEARIATEAQLREKSWTPSAKRSDPDDSTVLVMECAGYDLYIDEFLTPTAARHFARHMLAA